MEPYSWIGVKPMDLPIFWPMVEEKVARALEHGSGELEVRDILVSLTSGKMQLWIMGEAGEARVVGVTEIQEFPQMKICLILVCAGEGVHRAIPLLKEVLVPWARENGCAKVRLFGREGWQRMLKGWTKTCVVLEIDTMPR